MRKILLITFSIILILCFSVTSFADQNAEGIKIELQKDGSAEVISGGESFEIKYMRYNNQILIGNGEHQDLLKLLNIASKMTGQKYDLTLRHRAWTDTYQNSDLPNYDVIITEYQGSVGHYGMDYLYNSSEFTISKIMEFYSDGSFRVDGWPYAFDDSMGPTPHVLFIDGKYEYYLPLRYICEQFGFSINYEKAADKETISIYE